MDGTWDKTDEYYGEKGLTECLKRMAAITDPDEAIADLLAFLGGNCLSRIKRWLSKILRISKPTILSFMLL